MANNRMFVYCTKCNKHQYIAKSYGDSWSSSPLGTMASPFLDFVDEHFFCGEEGYSKTVELRWESGREGKELPGSSVKESG